MPGRAERASDNFQRFQAKIGTAPHLLAIVILAVAVLVLLVAAVRLHPNVYLLSAMLTLALGTVVIIITISFSILPEWMTREMPKGEGDSRWAKPDEIEVLYGPPDFTAP